MRYCSQLDKDGNILYYRVNPKGTRKRISKYIAMRHSSKLVSCKELENPNPRARTKEVERDIGTSGRSYPPDIVPKNPRKVIRTIRRKSYDSDSDEEVLPNTPTDIRSVYPQITPSIPTDEEDVEDYVPDTYNDNEPNSRYTYPLKIAYEAIERVRKSSAYRDENELPGFHFYSKVVVECSWLPPNTLYRLKTIGDGNCFIHAVLQASDEYYQESNNKRQIARHFRDYLAHNVKQPDPDNPPFIYWESYRNASYFRIAIQQIMLGELIDGVDYSVTGLQKLWRSNDYLGNESYGFVADILDIDIYIFYGTEYDLYPVSTTKVRNINERDSVAIVGNSRHWETLEYQGMTLFPPDHIFVQTLRLLFDDNDPISVDIEDNIKSILIANTKDNKENEEKICNRLGVFRGMESQKIIKEMYDC